MGFIDTFGLINSREDERNAENAFPWTYENILLTEESNTSPEVRIKALRTSIAKSRISPGLFHQNPSFALSEAQISHDRYMSPDQLISITGFSSRYHYVFAEEIWKEIKGQQFRYDNMTPDKPVRYIRPWDLVFYGYCAGSFICKLLVVLISIACIVSCLRNKNETSGKLLAYIKCKSLPESFIMRQTFKLCTFLVNKKNTGWNDVFSIYFKEPNHPNKLLAEKVYG